MSIFVANKVYRYCDYLFFWWER